MASYFNVNQVAPGLVEFTLYNLRGHIDGHITVWMRVDTQLWCWARMGGYAGLTCIREDRTMAPQLPTEQDQPLLGELIRQRMAGTCDERGRFIYPEDQQRADDLQREFDALPPDAWQRNLSDPLNAWGLPYGARQVMTGCPFGGATCELLRHLRDPRWRVAAELLGLPVAEYDELNLTKPDHTQNHEQSRHHTRR